jgi:NADPH-ferrihemoprotein reductase
MGDAFKLITAFSRDSNKKVYVQHRLEEHKAEVNELIKQGAYFYVCGDAAHMAREVNATLGRIIASERGIKEDQGHELVKKLRSCNLYQV